MPYAQTLSQETQQTDPATLSVTGKRWLWRGHDDHAAMALAQKTGLSDVVARVLHGRGISDHQAAFSFLETSLSALEDPNHLLDMDVAVKRLSEALQKQETLAVFGDYDVDGGCASALLIRFFRQIGITPLLYIPDRMTEGYGPNPQAMERLKEMGADLVITVDCGSVAYEPMARAKELGMDVIITDHHQTKPERPACVAFLNPNRIDETSPCTMLSGAGVAFYLAMALNRHLRETGFYTPERPEPDLRKLLDLVAVSTICDMVPLTGVNRILVKAGLKVLGTWQNPGFKALATLCKIDDAPTPYHAGFLIGPRINAGGRIDACDLGARCLSTDDWQEAQGLALKLDQLNEERKGVEKSVLEEALHRLKSVYKEGDCALVIEGADWHAGVIGIVASRLKEKVHRPTFVISTEGGEGKGSGRSITGIDLAKMLRGSEELLLKGGGHKMAAGITLKPENIPAFREKLNALVKAEAQALGEDIFTPSLKYDAVMSLAGAHERLLQELEKVEPYGMGNPEPRFIFSGVNLYRVRPVGKDGSHIQVVFGDAGGVSLSGIAFRAMDSDLGPFLLGRHTTSVTLLGTLRRESWNGRESVKLHIEDARPGRYQP